MTALAHGPKARIRETLINTAAKATLFCGPDPFLPLGKDSRMSQCWPRADAGRQATSLRLVVTLRRYERLKQPLNDLPR